MSIFDVKKKKWVALLAIIFSIATTSAIADDSTGSASTPTAPVTMKQCQSASDTKTQLLCYITLYTYGTLLALNNLPEYISNWTSADQSDTSASLQASFSTVNNDALSSITTQAGLQQQLLGIFFATNGITKQSLNGGANDLAYQSLQNVLYFNPDPRTTGSNPQNVDIQMDYIQNASGLNVSHPLPTGSGFKGSLASRSRYSNYFNTISAVQTYNAYALSRRYAEYKNGNQLSKDQTALIQQASDSTNWFKQVAQENIGIVLRQILMYDSQTYVLMTQLLQTEKELLTAQTMNNSLLILLNMPNEDTLYKKAIGTMAD